MGVDWYEYMRIAPRQFRPTEITENGHAAMTTQPKQPSWPDSNLFWRNQRVTVTGGAGFLGSFVVDKLRERGATEICVSRKQDYDLVHREAVLELLVIRGKNPIFATNDTNYHESEHFVKTRGRERNP